MKKDFQDSIDKYVLGRMSDAERAQFKVELSQDRSKEEQLEFTENVISAITSREDKLARIKMMQMMYDRESHKESASMQATGTNDCQYAPAPYREKIPSRLIGWWASGIAAVLVIVLFVVNPFGSDILLIPSGISPSLKGSPNEIIQGEENAIFNIYTPEINDSIVNDTIQLRDTVIVIKEILNK